MAIGINATKAIRGAGRAAPLADVSATSGISLMTAALPGIGTLVTQSVVPPVAQPPVSPGAGQPVSPPTTPTAPPVRPPLRPDLVDVITTRPDVIKPLPFPLPPLTPAAKTATQLAQGAINQLSAASPELLRSAVTVIRNNRTRVPNAQSLMHYLERRVIIGEVLNDLARDWQAETRQDFADAFQIETNQLDLMDTIVSIAILNDRDLEEELRGENLSTPSDADLLDNRRVVYQYPPAGTLLEPPYLMLIAVEYFDAAKAQEVVDAILGGLVEYEGIKLPKAAAQKL